MKVSLLITCCMLPCCTSSAEDPQMKPWRCRGSPFALKKPPRDRLNFPRPHFARIDQQPFVPYNILYLIDEGIDQEDRAKLKMATDYASERLSKMIKARRLDDVRYHNLDPRCDEMCENVTFPKEFTIPCSLATKQQEPTEKIRKLNEANYTLVVRVLVDKQGDMRNKHIEGGCIEDADAFAQSCEMTDSELDRGPHHGFFIYCEKPSSRSDNDTRALVLHETLHILMPYSLSGIWANDHVCESREDCKDKSWKEAKTQALDSRGQPVEINVGIAIGPFLRKAAIDHFDCDTVEGVEMNFFIDRATMEIKINHGHWSQHLFPDEIMSPYQGTSRFSNLTLSALASHTNWYRVDQSQAEPLAHSKPSEEFACDVAHKGCFQILREQTGGNEVKFIRPYCDHRQGADRVITSHCSPDHRRQLSCVNHLGNSRCSFLTGTTNMYDNEVCAIAISMVPGSLATQVGASFGPGTVCVTTTNFPPWESHKTNALCVHHECHVDALILMFKPNNNDDPDCYIVCPQTRSNQLLTVNWCNTATHQVTIICPDYEKVCTKEPTATETVSAVRTLTTTTTTSSTRITTTAIAATTKKVPTSPTFTQPTLESTASRATSTSSRATSTNTQGTTSSISSFPVSSMESSSTQVRVSKTSSTTPGAALVGDRIFNILVALVHLASSKLLIS